MNAPGSELDKTGTPWGGPIENKRKSEQVPGSFIFLAEAHKGIVVHADCSYPTKMQEKKCQQDDFF